MRQTILQPVEHTYCDVCGNRIDWGNGGCTGTVNKDGENIHICHKTHIAIDGGYDYKRGEKVNLDFSCEDLFTMLNALDLISVPKNRFK